MHLMPTRYMHTHAHGTLSFPQNFNQKLGHAGQAYTSPMNLGVYSPYNTGSMWNLFKSTCGAQWWVQTRHTHLSRSTSAGRYSKRKGLNHQSTQSTCARVVQPL